MSLSNPKSDLVEKIAFLQREIEKKQEELLNAASKLAKKQVQLEITGLLQEIESLRQQNPSTHTSEAEKLEAEKLEAERKAQEEAERKAQEEAARKAQEEAAKLAAEKLAAEKLKALQSGDNVPNITGSTSVSTNPSPVPIEQKTEFKNALENFDNQIAKLKTSRAEVTKLGDARLEAQKEIEALDEQIAKMNAEEVWVKIAALTAQKDGTNDDKIQKDINVLTQDEDQKASAIKVLEDKKQEVLDKALSKATELGNGITSTKAELVAQGNKIFAELSAVKAAYDLLGTQDEYFKVSKADLADLQNVAKEKADAANAKAEELAKAQSEALPTYKVDLLHKEIILRAIMEVQKSLQLPKVGDAASVSDLLDNLRQFADEAQNAIAELNNLHATESSEYAKEVDAIKAAHAAKIANLEAEKAYLEAESQAAENAVDNAKGLHQTLETDFANASAEWAKAAAVLFGKGVDIRDSEVIKVVAAVEGFLDNGLLPADMKVIPTHELLTAAENISAALHGDAAVMGADSIFGAAAAADGATA